jgi:hypothetical protein
VLGTPRHSSLNKTVRVTVQQQRKHGPSRDLKNVVCFSCNKKGHLSRDCRIPKTAATIAARKATSGNNNGPPPSSPSATFTYVFSIRVDVDIATTAQSAHLEDERWIVDSGAGQHFTGRRDALENFVHKPTTIIVSDDRKIVRRRSRK